MIRRSGQGLEPLRELTVGGRGPRPNCLFGLSRFEREVDPDGVLTAGERARRAEAARRAYFTRLAFQSSRARRRAG